MRNLCAFAFGVVFFASGMSVFAQTGGAWYMAFCSDGDGSLSEWATNRDDPLIAGRDHERANRGHRWEILVQHGKVPIRPSSCFAIAEDPARPDTVRIVNTCGTCKIFKVTRRNADGTSKSKEFKVKPKSQRHFLKRPDSEIVVEGEADCPDN